VGGNSLAVIDTIPATDLHRLGYPIAHVEADGSFIITKTPNTAGIVNTNTVKEQLVYEIHDPANYLTPDVIANFTTLKLEQIGENQVKVSGVTGKPRPEKLKLVMGRLEGYMRELIFTVGYPQAWKKVDIMKQMIESTWQDLAIDRIEYSYLGMNSLYGGISELPQDPPEIAIRVMFTAKDEDTLKNAVRLMMTNGLSGPAGMGISGSTVSASPRAILGLWSTLVNRDYVVPNIDFMTVE